ncbi:UPF0481 protein [Spatholobus suberectus]|nr:UPF0481 protein [Spatholobus suberectus]
MIPMEVMLGSLIHGEVEACSISRVTDELRGPNEAAFKPKEVSIGPLHRGTTSQVQEKIKWHYMREFLNRQQTQQQNRRPEQRLRECGNDIKKLHRVIIASYGGNMESEPEELAEIMIVDGCFLLELLMRLHDNMGNQNDNASSSSYSNDPLLENEEKRVSILNDITMLENQIPFIILKKLYRKVFPDDIKINDDKRVANIVRTVFGCTALSWPVGYWSASDVYPNCSQQVEGQA